jgi:hypothetical protein
LTTICLQFRTKSRGTIFDINSNKAIKQLKKGGTGIELPTKLKFLGFLPTEQETLHQEFRIMTKTWVTQMLCYCSQLIDNSDSKALMNQLINQEFSSSFIPLQQMTILRDLQTP